MGTEEEPVGNEEEGGASPSYSFLLIRVNQAANQAVNQAANQTLGLPINTLSLMGILRSSKERVLVDGPGSPGWGKRRPQKSFCREG